MVCGTALLGPEPPPIGMRLCRVEVFEKLFPLPEWPDEGPPITEDDDAPRTPPEGWAGAGAEYAGWGGGVYAGAGGVYACCGVYVWLYFGAAGCSGTCDCCGAAAAGAGAYVCCAGSSCAGGTGAGATGGSVSGTGSTIGSAVCGAASGTGFRVSP